ncbi:hypothetical protein Tco_1559328 [Tanacetum coccineum]
MGTFIQTPVEDAEDAEETEGALQLGPERARVFTDLTAEEKERYKADIRATNILLQCIPKDIYTLINHYTDAKDIWDNVKIILEVIIDFWTDMLIPFLKSFNVASFLKFFNFNTSTLRERCVVSE